MGTITGKVLYTNNASYDGITVILEPTDGLRSAVSFDYAEGRSVQASAKNNLTVKTDSDGCYSFTDVKPGTYTLYAAAQNSVERAVLTNVRVAEGKTTVADDLQLTITGSIEGTITLDSSTDANSGFSVFIGGTSYIAKTGSTGSFVISNVPAKASYDLYVEKGNFTYFWKQVEVKGKETTNAGTKNFTSEEIGSEASATLKHVTVIATSKGIEFTGSIPAPYQGSSNPASADIIVTEKESNIRMEKNFERPNWSYANYKMIYPFVEEGKEYSFTILVRDTIYSYYMEEVTITAKGGLGEYKLLNADDLSIELTEDKVFKPVGEPQFTDNPKVNITRTRLYYSLYGSNDKTDDFIWLTGGTCEKSSEDITFIDTSSKSAKGTYNALCGNKYKIEYKTMVQVAGYTGNGTIYFTVHNPISATGEFGGTKLKTLVVYGIPGEDYNYEYENFSIINSVDGDEYKCLYSNLPGESSTVVVDGVEHTYPYTEIYDSFDNIYEPDFIPTVEITEKNGEAITTEAKGLVGYEFSKWNIEFPYSVHGSSYEGFIGDEKYFIFYVSSIYNPVYKGTLICKLNDGTETIHYTAEVDSKYNNNSIHLDDIPKPEREGYIFKGWTDSTGWFSSENNRYIHASYIYGNSSGELVLIAVWDPVETE